MVPRFLQLLAQEVNWAFIRTFRNEGTISAASRAMIATAIISSMRVNPRFFVTTSARIPQIYRDDQTEGASWWVKKSLKWLIKWRLCTL